MLYRLLYPRYLFRHMVQTVTEWPRSQDRRMPHLFLQMFSCFCISQDVKHFIHRLFLSIDVVNNISSFIFVNDHMLWRGDQAMLDPSVTTDGVLVGAGMEEAYIQGLFIIVGVFWE